MDAKSKYSHRPSNNKKQVSRSRRSRSPATSRHRDDKSKYGKVKNDHKKQKRVSSSSSSSSSDAETSTKLIKKLEEKRYRDTLEKKRQKDELKAKETPEEKRKRRLQEKLLKEQKQREKMGWDTEYQHYTNQDNPFGDAHLTSTFVWNKKLDKLGLKNLAPQDIEHINRKKRLENKVELEKVKKRRQERELERVNREEELCLLQRSREAAQFEEWERQEDQFHLEQARLRSKIRIQDGRAKPIDLLAQYISDKSLEESIEMQMHEPYMYLNGLGVKDLEDLLIDINIYIELENGNNSEYWEDLTIIVKDELQKLQKMELENNGRESVVTIREGIHHSVAKDVAEIFRGKTITQLNELKRKIELKLSQFSDGIDIGYWESLQSQLEAYMARVRLRDKHHENLKHKLELLKKEQDIANIKNENDSNSEEEQITSANNDDSKNNDTESNKEDEEETDGNDMINKCFDLYLEGSYSPIYISPNDVDSTVLVITSEIDEDKIAFQRNRLIGQEDDEHHIAQVYSKDEILMRKEARKGMGGDEAEFSVETKLDSQIYLWSDKYRPRKPRYFNRVHTGFEWNKYNQTHYDMDNPPPKIVQGYKFNIFYPDLIDKNCTPQYSLTPCMDNKDFALLKFHAGPPYEDIAFKIVNREWEFSYKRGFRCQFHNNIFQLWFHFKRYRYRR